MSRLKEGSLFSGYNGLGLGIGQILDTELTWVSDIDKGACKILAHRYPDIPNHGDLTKIDWTTVEPVDIITGGFPCQDLSHAGKRAGMASGTRSGLWSYMHDAIRELRPRLVVAENVRGLLSAEALRDVEPCPWCVGDEPVFDVRALGTVVADLADIGYVGRWTGLRAADVGACHGRFRVFLIAYPADAERSGREWLGASQLAGTSGDVAGDGAPSALLPTPRSSDSNGAGAHGEGGVDLRTAISLLPTPRAGDGDKGGPNQRGSSGDLMLPSAVVHLLPTPTTQDGANNGGPSQLDRNSLPLNMLVTLLPTPRASDGPDASSHGRTWSKTDRSLHTLVHTGELPSKETSDVDTDQGGPTEVLRDVRDGDVPQEVRGATGRQNGVPQASQVLPVVCEHEGSCDSRCSSMAGAKVSETELRDVRDDAETACTPHRQKLGERRPEQSDDALRELPSETALEGGSGAAACGCEAWGIYAPAVHRWELVVGRTAPAPTEPTGKNGAHRLSPKATEFMMGLPDGWITDVPGITRNEALKACGNGVVPQQAAAALRLLLPVSEVAA